MPKESGPKGGRMNRRDFLKTAAAGAGVAALEKGANAQQGKIADNHIEEFAFESDRIKINYPETPKKMTEEVEDLILKIENYKLTCSTTTSEREINESKHAAWAALKKLDSSLPDFSDDIFIRTLLSKVPVYLSEYGVFVMPQTQPFYNSENGKFTAFRSIEVTMQFLEIERIEREKVEQWGAQIERNILHIKGSVGVKGRTFTNYNEIPHAQNGFGNIAIFEPGIKEEFSTYLGYIQSFEDDIAKYSKVGGIDAVLVRQLSETNKPDDAIQSSMTKIIERMERKPTMEEFKAEILAHETRHLFDTAQGNYSKIRIIVKTSNPIERETQMHNIYIHTEMNSIIAQLRYGPNKKFTLYRLLGDSREKLGSPDQVLKVRLWIIGHIVGIVSENSESFGIKISADSPVGRTNQILSQLNELLDHPDMLDALWEQLISIHLQDPTEDIMGETSEQLRGFAPARKKEDSNSLYKIGIPAAVVAGGAAYLALKKFRERKEKISHQQKREIKEAQRKKDKKSNIK